MPGPAVIGKWDCSGSGRKDRVVTEILAFPNWCGLPSPQDIVSAVGGGEVSVDILRDDLKAAMGRSKNVANLFRAPVGKLKRSLGPVEPGRILLDDLPSTLVSLDALLALPIAPDAEPGVITLHFNRPGHEATFELPRGNLSLQSQTSSTITNTSHIRTA